jgi:hypothetical protein
VFTLSAVSAKLNQIRGFETCAFFLKGDIYRTIRLREASESAYATSFCFCFWKRLGGRVLLGGGGALYTGARVHRQLSHEPVPVPIPIPPLNRTKKRANALSAKLRTRTRTSDRTAVTGTGTPPAQQAGLVSVCLCYSCPFCASCVFALSSCRLTSPSRLCTLHRIPLPSSMLPKERGPPHSGSTQRS